MTLRLLILLSLLFTQLTWGAESNTSLEQLVPPVPGWVEAKPAAAEPAGTWDWVQLKTNEWIKGKIIVLYDDKLEFDSANFGVLSISWSRIIEVRSERKYRIGLDQGKTDLIGSLYGAEAEEMIIGRLYINQQKAYVSGDDGQQWTLDRDQILTITTGDPVEANFWTASATIGVTMSTGNTESESYIVFLDANRRTVNNRLILDYTGIIEEVNNNETANNARFRGSYDIFQTKDFFYRPVYLEYYEDDFQNLDYRLTYSPGIGFYLIDSSDVDWDVTLGPLYQKNSFISVEAGNDRTASSTGWLILTSADVDITPNIAWHTEYRLQTADDELGGDTQRLLTSLKFALAGQLKFNISLLVDRIENPVADEDGFRPEKTDSRLIFGLVYDY